MCGPSVFCLDIGMCGLWLDGEDIIPHPCVGSPLAEELSLMSLPLAGVRPLCLVVAVCCNRPSLYSSLFLLYSLCTIPPAPLSESGNTAVQPTNPPPRL